MRKKKFKDPTKRKIILQKINSGFMVKVWRYHIYFTTIGMRERKRNKNEKRKNRERLIRMEKLHNCSYRCELCGCEVTKVTAELHHIKPQSLYPELKNDPGNLMALCHDCHVGLHKEVTKKAYELQGQPNNEGINQ